MESVISSSSLTFKVQSSSVPMWNVRIIPQHNTIPIEVFALVVSCGVSSTLDILNDDLGVWDTNVNDDCPRRLCDLVE